MRAIKNGDRTYPVAHHFETFHANDTKGLTYFVIDVVPLDIRGGNREKKLMKLESRYIVELNSKQPDGLYVEENL